MLTLALALAQTDQAEFVRRDLTPLGLVLVPVFFLRYAPYDDGR